MQALTWVFIHGWGSQSGVWNALLEHLPVPALRWDIPGFGFADCQAESDSDLDALLDRWQQQLPSACVLVGWSLGGMLATRLAHRCPQQVHALITLACNPKFVADSNWPWAMAEEVFHDFCQRFGEDPAKTAQRFLMLQSQGDLQRRPVLQRLQQTASSPTANPQCWSTALSWLQELDNRAILPRLRCPQWHIYGEQDALVSAQVAQELALRGIHATVLEGIAHCPHLAQPEVLATRLFEWVNQVTGERISKAEIARSFGAAVNTYDQAAHLQRQIAGDLLRAVESQALPFQDVVVDLGCGTGFIAQQLQPHCGQMLMLDLAEAMVRKSRDQNPSATAMVADAEFLPLADDSINLIVSSLALQWCSSLELVLTESRRCLKAGGVVAFTTLAPGTLSELKQAWSDVDDYVHVNEFIETRAIREQVAAAGLELIELGQFRRVVYYAEVMTLLRELKQIGAHNMNPRRNRGLTLRSQLQQLQHAYQRFVCDDQYPATYEVILVIAKKGQTL